MSNEEYQKLYQALRLLGKNPVLRKKFIELCKAAEQSLVYEGKSVRDDITGPIVDALHAEAPILRKMLSMGAVFDFYYRSKIARDFVMSTPEIPDHVWEPQTTKLLLHLTSRAKNVIIGGAYFGDQAILIAKQIAAHDGNCHAFEPNQDQFGMLRHNAELNGLSNMKISPLGLWRDSRSRLKLIGDDSFAHPELVSSADDGDKQGFSTIAIDDYLRQMKIPSADLIMLDIEGAEFEVMQGAQGQLKLPQKMAPNIVFEVHRHYVDWSKGLENTDIIKYLKSYDYNVFAVRDFNSNMDMNNKPVEIIPVESVYLEGPPHGFNMLATKDSQLTKNSLFRVCQNVSPKLLLHKAPALHHPLS